MIVFFLTLSNCAPTKKTYSQKRGYLLLDITETPVNKKYYSDHNTKTKRKTYRKFKKKKKY